LHTKYETNIVAFVNLEILMIWFFFLLHLFLKPYREKLAKINKLESISFVALLTSFIVSSLFFNNLDLVHDDVDKEQKLTNQVLLIMGIYAPNVCFFSYGFYLLYTNEKYNIDETWKKSKEISLKVVIFLKSCLKTVSNCARKLSEKEENSKKSFERKGLRRQKRLNRQERKRIASVINVQADALDLNPLAIWEKNKSKEEENSKIVEAANRELKLLKSHYKRKMLLLKLRIKMLKQENKELTNKIRELVFQDKTTEENLDEEGKPNFEIIHASSTKVKKRSINFKDISSFQNHQVKYLIVNYMRFKNTYFSIEILKIIIIYYYL
jgi:hypothetical protein